MLRRMLLFYNSKALPVIFVLLAAGMLSVKRDLFTVGLALLALSGGAIFALVGDCME